MWRLTMLVVLGLLGLAIVWPASSSAATCSDYSNQKQAQEAADTVDADGDGIYCKSPPCPCSSEAGGGGNSPPSPPPLPPTSSSCTKPQTVKRITSSKTKYPNIRAHYVRAVQKGWPRILVINREGTKERRAKLLKDIPVVAGFDRDEYPPAVGRGRGSAARRSAESTRPDGRRTSNTSHQARTSRTARRWGPSFGRAATGRGFRYIFE